MLLFIVVTKTINPFIGLIVFGNDTKWLHLKPKLISFKSLISNNEDWNTFALQSFFTTGFFEDSANWDLAMVISEGDLRSTGGSFRVNNVYKRIVGSLDQTSIVKNGS
ncbi:unknown [Parasutterella excrementihominis CAG:233]|nr:unknown [Parasutterella excrementihominis CAG:233]